MNYWEVQVELTNFDKNNLDFGSLKIWFKEFLIKLPC